MYVIYLGCTASLLRSLSLLLLTKEVSAEQLSVFLGFLKMEVVRAIHVDLGDLAVLEEPSPALGAGFGNKVVSSANDEGGWELPGPPGGGLGHVVE